MIIEGVRAVILDAGRSLNQSIMTDPIVVDVATTEAIFFDGTTTVVDNVVLSEGTKVLVHKQANKVQNGIYIFTNGELVRLNSHFLPVIVSVASGDTYSGTVFNLDVPSYTLNTTEITYKIVTEGITGSGGDCCGDVVRVDLVANNGQHIVIAEIDIPENEGVKGEFTYYFFARKDDVKKSYFGKMIYTALGVANYDSQENYYNQFGYDEAYGEAYEKNDMYNVHNYINGRLDAANNKLIFEKEVRFSEYNSDELVTPDEMYIDYTFKSLSPATINVINGGNGGNGGTEAIASNIVLADDVQDYMINAELPATYYPDPHLNIDLKANTAYFIEYNIWMYDESPAPRNRKITLGDTNSYDSEAHAGFKFGTVEVVNTDSPMDVFMPLGHIQASNLENITFNSFGTKFLRIRGHITPTEDCTLQLWWQSEQPLDAWSISKNSFLVYQEKIATGGLPSGVPGQTLRYNENGELVASGLISAQPSRLDLTTSSNESNSPAQIFLQESGTESLLGIMADIIQIRLQNEDSSQWAGKLIGIKDANGYLEFVDAPTAELPVGSPNRVAIYNAEGNLSNSEHITVNDDLGDVEINANCIVLEKGFFQIEAEMPGGNGSTYPLIRATGGSNNTNHIELNAYPQDYDNMGVSSIRISVYDSPSTKIDIETPTLRVIIPSTNGHLNAIGDYLQLVGEGGVVEYRNPFATTITLTENITAGKLVNYDGAECNQDQKALGMALTSGSIGDTIEVQFMGKTTIAISGGAFNVGDNLVSDSSGRLKLATGGSINARALSQSTGAGQTVTVMLVP